MPLEQFDIILILQMRKNFEWMNIDFSINNLIMTVISMFIVISIYYYLIQATFSIVPNRWQILVENMYIFIYDLVGEQMGEKNLKYFPIFWSIFIYILGLNLVGLLPYSFAVTSHFIWTVYFSVSMCMGIFLIGLIENKLKFLKLFLPKVPLALVPLMLLIEIASYIIRSFSLAIRLSANIMAGHTLAHILGDAVVKLFLLKMDVVWVVLGILSAIMLLELGVACLQAYVFTLLLLMYLNDALNFEAH